MRHSPRQIRLVLFVVAGLLGLAATYIRVADLLPLEPSYVTSATYRSDLLADALSMYAVASVVNSAEFQRTASAHIGLHAIAGAPTGFRLTSIDAVQQRAESGLDNARELLRIKLRALALAEVEASRGYLEQLKEEAKLGRRSRAKDLESRAKPAEAPAEPVLTDAKKERATLLRREIDGLEAFLRYKQRPAWFDARVDSGALRGAQRDVEEARLKQKELSEVFTATSAAAKAQAKVVARKQNQLWALEKHLANALLRSHRTELKGLEKSAVVAVKQSEQSATSAVAAEATPGVTDEAPDDEWLSGHAQQLAAQSDLLEKKATLQQVSQPTTQLTRPMGYWLTLSLWVSSLGLLVGALFVRGGARPAPARQPLLAGHARIEGEAPSGVIGVERDDLVSHLAEALFPVLGEARNLLVVGRHGAQRSTLSLRLAHQLGEGGLRVRLVDFDLEHRPLSHRVGDPSSPGVSDLLHCSGPAEEFFASLPGSSVQFASAGTRELPESDGKTGWLTPGDGHSVTVVDAAFSSPLHLVLPTTDAVVCLYQPGTPWTEQETEALARLRSSGRPIWGVALGSSAVSRFF